jgi:hypothetical protein
MEFEGVPFIEMYRFLYRLDGKSRFLRKITFYQPAYQMHLKK